MTQPELTLPGSGTYIVAVSGGVDSIVLLHLLAGLPGYRLIIATLDHGWREESGDDTALVQRLAMQYRLPVVVARLLLPDRSEATARQYRYAFLSQLARDYAADGILLAHHGDDIRETVILNALRGAGRHGLSPMREPGLLVRPLRSATKEQIIAYARENRLTWNEDSSNADTSYRRNAVRHITVPAMPDADIARLDQAIGGLREINSVIDAQLDADIKALGLDLQEDVVTIPTEWLLRYSLTVRRHVLVSLVKKLVPYVQLRREQIERLALDVGNRANHSHFQLSVALSATLQRDKLTFTRGQ